MKTARCKFFVCVNTARPSFASLESGLGLSRGNLPLPGRFSGANYIEATDHTQPTGE